jgi:predicted nucleotidyltransferase component of viral defense system
MDGIVKMSAEERRLVFIQAEERLGLQAASIEKDFWVCWTLREVAGLPELGEHLTFKGGTSLSKAWKLIDRFSEDIDLVVDRDTLGFGGDASPERAASNNQRRKRIDDLIKACRTWVQERLQPALAERIAGSVPGPHSLKPDPDDEDGQCLLFEYPGAFREAEAGYVRPVVKIELGARSDDWPSESHSFTPYLAEALPEIVLDAKVSFRTLAAERTFLEKAMLLHEETFRPDDKPRTIRLARHYYDLWCLISRGLAEKAAADEELFKRVAEHRQAFFRWSWVDYETLRRGTLRLLPLEGQVGAWRSDYEAMAGSMFFGEVPTFEDVLKTVGEFARHFNESPGVDAISK